MSAAQPGLTKGDRTRRRLLDAAAAQLAHYGQAGTSLAEIAAQAGLKTGSVYFHFGSKDELIATVLEEGLRESLRHLQTALDPLAGADPGVRLWAAVRAHLDALVELSDYATVVLTMPEREAGAAVASYRSIKQHYGGQWTELVDDAQRAGVIAAGVEPRLVRDLLFGAMNAVADGRARPGRSPEDCSDAVRALLAGPAHHSPDLGGA